MIIQSSGLTGNGVGFINTFPEDASYKLWKVLLSVKALSYNESYKVWKEILDDPCIYAKENKTDKNLVVIDKCLILNFEHLFEIESENGILAFFLALNDYPKITSIAFSNCVFNSSVWLMFVLGLSGTTYIDELLFRSCPLNASHIAEFVDGMSFFKHNLKRLGFCDSDFDEEMVEHLVKLLPLNQALEELTLINCGIENLAVRNICEALRQNNKLTELRLMRGYVGDQGAHYLAELLRWHSTLQTLALWENEIGDEGAKALGDALVQNGRGTNVDLGLQKNRISDSGAKYLARYGTRLIRLGLQGNKNIKTLKVLERALQNNNLRSISLTNTGITGIAVDLFLKRKKVDLTKQIPLEVFLDGGGLTIPAEKLNILECVLKVIRVKVVRDLKAW